MTATRQQTVTELVERAAAGLGLQLVDVKISQNKLNVYVDGADGDVTLDECRKASRAIEQEIEDGGLFPGKYVLEVSSPGAHRPLRNARDFSRVAGRTLTVTYGAEAPATVTGVLAGADETGFDLDDRAGKRHRIVYSDIRKAKIKYVI